MRSIQSDNLTAKSSFGTRYVTSSRSNALCVRVIIARLVREGIHRSRTNAKQAGLRIETERLSRAATTADPWICGFVMVHRASDAVVGSCAYKSPPDPDGVVEIAYEVDPEHQGRGYATEAAQAMAANAFASGRVRIVRAHTMPEPNASTRVLTKCGFEHLGEVVEPDDGLVWRWELHEPG